MRVKAGGREKGLVEFWEALLDLIYPPPPQCALCGEKAAPAEGICAGCLERLAAWRLDHPACPSCGRFLHPGADCRRCAAGPPPYHPGRALGPYQGLLGRALRDLKYRGRRDLARPLGRLLAAHVRREPAFFPLDLVLAVPASRNRLRERGYNQAELLARQVARELGLPAPAGVLVKARETRPQTGLSRERRRENLRGAFRVARPAEVAGKSVLLVDDVLTTGSTLREASQVLLAAGALRVAAATVAASQERGS